MIMARWQTLATVVALALCSMAPAQAVNKCTAANGQVTYQDDDCSGGKAEKANIPHYRPPPPAGAVAAPAPAVPVAVAATAAHSAQPKNKGIPEDAVVHTGPRGGRYIILPSGKKRYLPKEESASR